MADLSLVIPAFICDYEVELLSQTTLPAYRNSGVDLELIVVDNGGFSGHDYLAEHADILVRFKENQGYSGGVNAGLVHATADTICVSSIDIVVPEGWAQPFLDAQPLVASPLETGHEVRRQAGRGLWWGAMFAFPREALETVGLMDTETFSAFADRDYAVRLGIAGYEFTRVDVPVEHYHGNHAFRYLKRQNPQEVWGAFEREVEAFRRRYGANEFSDWWVQNHERKRRAGTT